MQNYSSLPKNYGVGDRVSDPRIDLMRIQYFYKLRILIQFRIHGFDDQKLKNFTAEKKYAGSGSFHQPVFRIQI
jgi:hypothetical protein